MLRKKVFVLTALALSFTLMFAVAGCDLDGGGGDGDKRTPVASDYIVTDFSQSYNGSPKAVTITPKSGKSAGTLTVFYEGINLTVYPKTTTPPTNVGFYEVSFNVASASGWNQAEGLSAGTLTITTHTHTPVEAWSSDATHHWHECVDGDDARLNLGAHTGDPCSVCGYTSGTESSESMDDYYDLEPEMAPNDNRAMAKAGETTEIGIPDYLLPAEAPRAAVNATFAVHEDDTAIAEITSQNGIVCTVKGLRLGSARVIVTVGNRSATVIVAVAPREALYTLPAAEVRRLGEVEFYNAWWHNNRPDGLPGDRDDYTADPTYQLAWNWRNPNDYYGASGDPCGIDILSYFVDPAVADRRGWVRTTFGHGGWHYDLNGVTDEMVDGVQETGDVRLELKPEFIYDNGVPYLQITHTLTNTGSTALTDQKFGASADVMIFNQDDAPLTYLEYGALMTNENTSYGTHYLPTVKLRLVCQAVQGVTNVSSLYLGTYPGERTHVYEDKRDDITAEDNRDTALNFSYQGISLNPGQSKDFVVRFTQVQ